ncbi:MAG: hypothetical protein RLZZ299_1406, partial [Pseudomonadota bacterium]
MSLAGLLLAARLASAEAPDDVATPEEELDVVAGPTKVTRARAALYQSLRDRGYRKGKRQGAFQVFLAPEPWKPRVLVHDDGWITVRREPPRLHPPGKAFASDGRPQDWLWCAIMPTSCISLGGWLVGARKMQPQIARAYDSTRAEVRALNDAVAEAAFEARLNHDIPAQLEGLWSAPLPAEERRRALFDIWDSRAEDNPEGRAVRQAVADFLDAIVQTSPEPFTEAELATLN